ncbi:hypothetical protein ACTFIY_003500 [Dictyostelium cf. discoideum]
MNYLDSISNPTFCCGDSEVVSSTDPNKIVAHGENTVNQWFADAPYGIVDDSQCPSYRVDFPFEVFTDCIDCSYSEISSYPFSYSNINLLLLLKPILCIFDLKSTWVQSSQRPQHESVMVYL